MEPKKEIKITVECTECHKEILVGQTELHAGIPHMRAGKTIFLTSYICPHCGCVHYCQVDNALSMKLLDNATKQFNRLAGIRIHSQLPISKQQNDKFVKARKRLVHVRQQLINEYTGKTVVEVSSGKEIVNLRFDLCR